MKNLALLAACAAAAYICVGCTSGAGEAPPIAATPGSKIFNTPTKPGESQSMADKHHMMGHPAAVPGSNN